MERIDGRRVILPWVFALTLFVIYVHARLGLLGGGLPTGIDWMIFCLPIALFAVHMVWLLGLSRGALFMLLSALIGLFFEIIGVRGGTFFGGPYFYDNQNLGPLVLGVPVLVPLFWSIFMYMGYVLTSSSLTWLGLDKPAKDNNNRWLLPLLVLLDGVAVVAIDLFMDPLMVHAGNWTWRSGGLYFGVPIGNFVGWFIVTVLSTGIFRIIEYLFPRHDKKRNDIFMLLPVLGYGGLCMILFLYALRIHLFGLAAVGLSVMMPLAVANLILFSARKKS